MKIPTMERWLQSATPEQRDRVHAAAAEAVGRWTGKATHEQIATAGVVACEVAVLAELWRVYAGKDGCGG